MKSISHNIRLACLTAALLLAACTADEPVPVPMREGAVIYSALSFGVSEMTMTADSRAAGPMNPDMEKYVKTIAIFEFDSEGLHEKKETVTYHFIDFIAGTVDGEKNVGDVKPTEFGVVETTLEGLRFEERDSCTICLVANVTEDQVDKLYKDIDLESEQSYGHMTFDQFKQWTLPFKYEPVPTGKYDESVTGHLQTMYMFGYYQGELKEASVGSIRVDLGRLASRLDITVVNETGADITERLGYHFDNVCTSAFLFPMKQGLPPTDRTGLARTVICSGPEPVEGDEGYNIVPQVFRKDGVHTRYFYVAAHSAKDWNEATQLHLFYNRKIESDDLSDDSNSVRVPLCNVHPQQAADVVNGYSLSRNTRYHFTIRLRKKDGAALTGAVSSRAGQEQTGLGQTAAYGDRPGEITVYLP